MKKLALLVLSLVMLVSCDTSMTTNSSMGEVKIIELQQNVKDPQSGLGMVITVDYKIVGTFNPPYMCAIAFGDADGKPLVDKNNSFCDGAGHVVCVADIEINESAGSIRVFMPYSELDLSSQSLPIELKMAAGILNSSSEEMCRSEILSFRIL